MKTMPGGKGICVCKQEVKTYAHTPLQNNMAPESILDII